MQKLQSAPPVVFRGPLFQQQTSKSKRPQQIMTTAAALYLLYIQHNTIFQSGKSAIEKDTNGIFNVIINMSFG